MNWLGNQINRFTEFSLLKQRSAPFVLVLSHSKLVFYLVCFFVFFDSLRKVLTNSESLSQPAELVGTPD